MVSSFYITLPKSGNIFFFLHYMIILFQDRTKKTDLYHLEKFFHICPKFCKVDSLTLVEVIFFLMESKLIHLNYDLVFINETPKLYYNKFDMLVLYCEFIYYNKHVVCFFF